jgi:hypothetical protein
LVSSCFDQTHDKLGANWDMSQGSIDNNSADFCMYTRNNK